MEEEKKKYADFSQMRNDMYWNFHEYDLSSGHFHRVKWTGYNDSYWWDNVAVKEGNNIHTCECGKKFELDYKTNEVKELNARHLS